MTTRRPVGSDVGIASAHTLRVLDEFGGTAAERMCWPGAQSPADAERAAAAGTRSDVIMEPTGPV